MLSGGLRDWIGNVWFFLLLIMAVLVVWWAWTAKLDRVDLAMDKIGTIFLIGLLIVWGWEGRDWLDEHGWIEHSHDTPVWIKGDWMVGEYRDCGMRTKAAQSGVVLSQEAKAKLPRLFCGDWGAQKGGWEFMDTTPDSDQATNAMFRQGDWKELDRNFHVLPVRYQGRIDRLDKLFVSWRCQRLSQSLECKALD
jgi:hypothetical protein